MGAPAVLAGAAILSAAGTAYGTYKTAQAQEYNAKVEEQQAEAEQQKAAYDERIHRDRVRQLLSRQRALYGKSGVELSGSPLLVLEDTAAKGELDALAIRYGGATASQYYRSQAQATRERAGATRLTGYARAGSTLLSGYGRYRQATEK